jgi:chemotaxis protein CheC
MSIKNVDSLQDMHLDVLKEIGNIGSGNAASALSEMLSQSVDIEVPSVKQLEFADAVAYLGGPENIVIGMLVSLEGDISGMMLYVLQKEFASQMTSAVLGSQLDDLYNMDEMQNSFIREVGNILSASYINAISSLTGLYINITVPDLTIDMVGAILSVPAIAFAHIGNKALFIDDSFIFAGHKVKSNMILVPEMSSLETLFTRLGVSV